ncbi:cytochrome b [Lichenibacterium dinghuense]|uniref:cytochrome b n=1 Tax=Lichenibacterium dinghuense TaxID=2895977 RepID=UPI001F39F585|nr:cytochrome b [Lichenibacterium sp. 6Y81]
MTTLDLSAADDRPAAAPTHYDRTQRAFHWSMAAVIVAAMLIGLYCAYQPPGQATRRFLLEWHKSLGMTALVLVVLRIGYRLAVAAPPYAERMGRLNHAAAAAGHLGLYALMLFLPLTGYWNSAAGGYSLPFFWLFQWPRLIPLDKASSRVGEELHYWGAWAIYAVVGLHVAAVLWHQMIKRDSVLSRMLPGLR